MLKFCLLLSCANFAFGSAIDYGTSKGWFVPQSTGGFAYVTREEFDIEFAKQQIEPRDLLATFYLYTRANPTTPEEISVNDATALASSNFNKNNPTRFVIHGWTHNYLSAVNVEIRSALLDTGVYNVFCVDWSRETETINYPSARYAVPGVGQLVANYIDFLNEKGGMSFDNLTLIGHSFGAHVSGYAGKLAKRGKVHMIVGLDPALPLFSYDDCATRLCTTDASYVESIQTCGGKFGFVEPIGEGAFYPSGGVIQPGCGLDLIGICSHLRSYDYYAEAIRYNDFRTMECDTYMNAVLNNCGSTYSSVRMGAPSNYGVSGYFYVPVNSKAPYGMG